MESNFAPSQKFNYQEQVHYKDKQKELVNRSNEKSPDKLNKIAARKRIWQSFNIFSKIRKFNKAKVKETDFLEEEPKSQIVEEIKINKDIKKNMSEETDNKSESTGNDSKENVDEVSNSVESRNSFFGKMNLENLLKVFVDLHKKKQAPHSSKSSKEPTCQQEKSIETDPNERENFFNTEIDTLHAIQRYNSSSNNTIYSDNTDISLFQSESLQNPVNSPGLLHNNFDKDESVNISRKVSSTSKTDSTLSLLENVRIKLKDYMFDDINVEGNNYLDEKETVNKSNIKVHNVQSVPTSFVAENDGQQNKISEDQNAKVTEESNDKKMAYTIVEGDIKCMIKELLKESKDLRNSIVATGIKADSTPLFTESNKDFDSILICRNICNDLIKLVSNKNKCSTKSKKHQNVTMKQDANEDVERILTNILDNVLQLKSYQSQPFNINYCIVQDNEPKHKNDPNNAKFCESSVYYLTKKMRKSQHSTKKVAYTPKVTVHNLSARSHIKFISSESSLTNRIRRSAALLMALYDEMRDYSYYSCTSNILCDLYESMVKQGLISVATRNVKKSIENLPTVISMLTDSNGENNRQEVSKKTSVSNSLSTRQIEIKEFNNCSIPSSSSDNNPTDSFKLIISASNDSFSSESDEDEIKKRIVLPNLKYTYHSDEEINTPEEVKVIDDNVSKNSGTCKAININEISSTSNESINIDYTNIAVNESEAFLKK